MPDPQPNYPIPEHPVGEAHRNDRSIPTSAPATRPENPLLTGEGRGVKGGVPYGQQLLAEDKEMARNYKFRPAAAARLRAATRRALGR